MKVNGTQYRTIWPETNSPEIINIIDQRQLPFAFVIEQLTTVSQVVDAIRDMHVRGAGLIGATAGFGMHIAACCAPDNRFMEHMQNAAKALGESRPTARNLKWAIERVMKEVSTQTSVSDKRRAAFSTACAIADEDAEFCKKIGEHGRKLIEEISRRKNGQPVNILTHCNAGWLAFVDYGSATAPIYGARDAGIPLHVWVDETRPWNQGAKLTAWELQQEGIDNTLITDNAGGHLMQIGMVDLVIVGTDRTTRTGDVANKIGTYLKALAARDNNIPFYVALPSSTFDWNLDNGQEIPIEIRSGGEITEVTGTDASGSLQTVTLAAPGTRAANYSFDITPARLVTGLITERGITAATPAAIAQLFPEYT
ncbi:S-methyl-5-thioribose-1-phosphate isomerase [Desulfopila aestuarii]|uniref:Methylthioribose-1-phosphate isomerase n=1 Tax=Desulfopila aestuarii DSM 18488 TaxID=1121416 RepID=A0A1M7YFN0_9BACT|nr:S-methyl-5-thioribose-1-phosphate isomerase [Desulfopila aestuarii]SHO51430.1 methylthioribose-1-phosphate isomerase [Desulfopila aestuarii DSM 18488]